MIMKTSLMAGALLAASVCFANDYSNTSTSTTSGAPDRMATDTTVPSAATAANMDLREGVDYQVLTFPRGKADLSTAQKKEINSLLLNAAGGIDNIHVAVWSDQAFPKNSKTDLPKASRDLADKRIDAIKTYLNSMHAPGVETYSMAESANWFQRAFNTDAGELKSLFSQQGAPRNVDESQFRIVRAKGGPEKAVILIERKSADRQPSVPTTH